ncbi:SH3 domain-containing protein [Halarcobacter anaerophilus]|uniref:SH3 domain-containing protein n=1 Tax=Halarcobacter anaerophilus TaxID=877500 RepID=A0A4Q0XU74_9BACT|nr:hypothetical protein [Halarcobacter anaerophilus]QDF28506.1 hypothetical protein AANAER_1020 [Halarcobacter anaerophilus]RXJ61097.1 hypothetical protein CRV06_14755 [Halarcobacter anaerophilus]
MKKFFFLISIFVFFNFYSLANTLQNGLYYTDDKNCVQIKINNDEYIIFNYIAFEKNKKEIRTGKLIKEKDFIQFKGLKSTFYSSEKYGQEASDIVGANLIDDTSFGMQNYGNSMNPYIVFGQCESKYIIFTLSKNTCIILPTKQPLYKKPNIKTKMYLIKGDKVEVLEEKDDWLYILYHGKKDIKAWIPKNSVE